MKANTSKKKLSRLVAKFGGTSLADGASISRAADSVAKKAAEGANITVVVSAMGRTTDQLINATKQACRDAAPAAELDDIMGMGERTSSRIFAAALKARGQKSRYVDPCDPEWPIITDDTFNKATPILPICEEAAKSHLQPLLEKGVVVVVPGFIGRSESGKITTMGRGGSDITALVLARALSADQVIVVTDVEGIMTADPKIIEAPERLREISMDTLLGIADSGPKFIHKKALRYKSPEIDIKMISNTVGNLDSEGTIIHGSFPSTILVESYPKPAIAVTIVGKETSESPETLVGILQEVRNAGAPILGMSINHNSLVLYLPMDAADNLLESLHSIVIKDRKTLALAVRKNLAFVRVKGLELEETPGILSSITKALNSAGVNIYGIFTITSSIMAFVDFKDKERTVRLTEETLRTNTK